MKAKSIVNQYQKLLNFGQEYLDSKVNLENIVNDYFMFFVVDIVPSPTSNKLRLMLDNVDGDFNFINIYYFDSDASEFDYFIECKKKGIEPNVKVVEHTELKKLEPPIEVEEICGECGEVHILEGH